MVLNTNLNRVEEDGEIKRIRVSSLRGKRWSQFRFREICNVHGIEKKPKRVKYNLSRLYSTSIVGFILHDNSFSNLPPAMIKICLTLAKLEGAYQINY